MMVDFATLKQGLADGSVVPILGPDALLGSCDSQTREPIPADNRSLILAMNQGREMMPRLMYEFSRAAQHVEQRRGQAAVHRFLHQLYQRPWTHAPLNQALAQMQLPWVVDLNRDQQLLELYADRSHLVVQGVSRIMEGPERYQLYYYDGQRYRRIDERFHTDKVPVIFKPLGSGLPEPNFIASDADFVDYLTELMGGFAIPRFLKQYRKERQYLLLGLPLDRDTQRMLVTEISYDSAQPKGWVMLPDPSRKEQRFCERQGLAIIPASSQQFTDFLLRCASEQAC